MRSSQQADQWQLEESLAQKVDRGRRLLTESEEYRDCVDLQNFLSDTDATVAVHRAFVDGRGEWRRGLTEREVQQGLVCFLSAMLHKLMLPGIYLNLDAGCHAALLSAAHDLLAQHEASATPRCAALRLLAAASIAASTIATQGNPRTREQGPQLGLQMASGMAEEWARGGQAALAAVALEGLQQQAGLNPRLTAGQLRRMLLLLQRICARTLLARAWEAGEAMAAGRHLAAAELATDQLVQLWPDAAAHHQQHGVDATTRDAHEEAAARYTVALEKACASRAYATEAMAAACLANACMFGGRGRRWTLAEVQALLDRAQAAVERCRPWMPAAMLKPMQGEVARVRAVAAGCARERPGRALLPAQAGQGTPQEAFVLQGCDQCGLRSIHLRKCSACKLKSYCSKECQRKAWKQGGHKAECAELAAAASARHRS